MHDYRMSPPRRLLLLRLPGVQRLVYVDSREERVEECADLFPLLLGVEGQDAIIGEFYGFVVEMNFHRSVHRVPATRFIHSLTFDIGEHYLAERPDLSRRWVTC